jgi:AcrR family transcriptional regulator
VARRTLSRQLIVTTCIELIDREGPDKFTLRRLGDVLGTDPTAIYRHFRDKDELTRAVGDEILRPLWDDLPGDDVGWRAVLRELCLRLRAAYLGHPGLTALVAAGPPMQENEIRLTEAMLHQLQRSGLGPADVGMAYHAAIELTLGAAAMDGTMSLAPVDERQAAYRRFRATYAGLDQERFPATVESAAHLWVGSADDRFAYALDRLLDGIEHHVGAG